MANFDKTSEERRKDVLDRRYYVSLVDRNDEAKSFHFDCGNDLLFFLSFVDWSSYYVVVVNSVLSSTFDFSNLGVSPQEIQDHD